MLNRGEMFKPGESRSDLRRHVAELVRRGKIKPSPVTRKSSASIRQPLGPKDASACMFRWLLWLAEYRLAAATARLIGCTAYTLSRWKRGKNIPRLRGWQRLLRDARWRVDHGFKWSFVTGYDKGRLVLSDGEKLPDDEMPEPDRLPTHEDMRTWLGGGGYIGNAAFGELLRDGNRTVADLKAATLWPRIGELTVWKLAGYPTLALKSVRWKERDGVTWQDMLAAKRDLELPRMLRKLDNFDLLIIDDLGYLPQGAEESEVLFTLIAERYERRSLGITSNLVFSEWEKVFANPMATAAAIDRIVHHSVILEFDVPSYRTNAARNRQVDRESDRQNSWRTTGKNS